MVYNTNAIDFGERIGQKLLGTYRGDSKTTAVRDTYDARLMIETTPDPLQRMLIKRDVNLGFAAALASRKLVSSNPLIV